MMRSSILGIHYTWSRTFQWIYIMACCMSTTLQRTVLQCSHNSTPYSALQRFTSLLAVWEILAVLWGFEINHQILYVHRKFLLLTRSIFCPKLIVNNVYCSLKVMAKVLCVNMWTMFSLIKHFCLTQSISYVSSILPHMGWLTPLWKWDDIEIYETHL